METLELKVEEEKKMKKNVWTEFLVEGRWTILFRTLLLSSPEFRITYIVLIKALFVLLLFFSSSIPPALVRLV